MARKVKKTYVVRKGRIPGIYYTWEDCKEQVDGFKGNNYESYVSLEDAEQAWQRHLVTLASATVVAALAPPIELFAAADPVEKRIRIEIPDSEDDPGMLWNPLKVAVC